MNQLVAVTETVNRSNYLRDRLNVSGSAGGSGGDFFLPRENVGGRLSETFPACAFFFFFF